MEVILTKERDFVDEFGRERIFNGVNFCDKQGFDVCKYKFRPLQDRSVLKKCKDCGFNIIRLGFTWAAVEPHPNCYNDKYLDDIGDILDCAAENGIYVYLDIHQDLYSESKCFGDGAPHWATLTDGYTSGPAHFVWAEGYFFKKAIHRAFDNFWNNKKVNGKGLQDYYADMWCYVAEKFKDKPALFGFDIMNEPFPGTDGGKIFKQLVMNAVKTSIKDKRINVFKLGADFIKDGGLQGPLKQFSGDVFHEIVMAGEPLVHKFDIEKYSPFLNKASAAIREKTDKGIIFMETCYYGNLGIPTSAPAITVNGKRESKLCYSPHSYDLTVDTPIYKFADNSRVGSMFAEHKRAQERLNVPVMVGEWGSQSVGISWIPHIEFLLELFDNNKWSNTYWAFGPISFKLPICNTLSRPYPKAVTGEIVAYRFDRKDNTFTLEFNQKDEFTVPNVVYLTSELKQITLDGKKLKKFDCEKLTDSGSCDISFKTDIGSHKLVISL